MMNSNLEQIQERQRVRARIVSLATVVCLTAAMFTVTAFAANTDCLLYTSPSPRDS